MGGNPRLKMEEVIHTPGDRFRLHTTSSGVVHLKIGECPPPQRRLGSILRENAPILIMSVNLGAGFAREIDFTQGTETMAYSPVHPSPVQAF